jgi:hypothetical protein
VLGDRGYDINSYDLDDGNLTIRAANLLGFETGLDLKQSIVPGFLTLIGTGKFLASSNGPVIFVEPPMRVDPEALLGWADTPSPCHHYDAGWMQGFLGGMAGMVLGMQSGEERQFDFTGTGTVLLQSSEQPREDPAVVRQLEGQLHGLGPSGLGRLQTVIQQKLGQQVQYARPASPAVPAPCAKRLPDQRRAQGVPRCARTAQWGTPCATGAAALPESGRRRRQLSPRVLPAPAAVTSSSWYRSIASRGASGLTSPRRASSASVATTIDGPSTRKCRRRAPRVSERPKPSVPREVHSFGTYWRIWSCTARM